LTLRVEDAMITDVITIRMDYPVKYADSLMKYFKTNCLVVMNDKMPIGMLTNHDIIRRVFKQNKDPYIVLVGEAMSKPLIFIGPDEPLQDAYEIMNKNDIRRLPVIGKLSEGPVLLGLLLRKEVTRKVETPT
jgi:CBS domain-containing protein